MKGKKEEVKERRERRLKGESCLGMIKENKEEEVIRKM